MRGLYVEFIRVIAVVVLSSSAVAFAQVTLDGTLGPAGSLPGPAYQIPAEVGRQVGGNLFHSFGKFSLYAGESATFTGPDSVKNVIGRVTGGEASWLDGTLRSTIPNADLYLLNPAGILFGPNASLNMNGSFHASTANYLRLGEEGRFDATEPRNSLLTSAPPSAFGFLGDNPAPITVQGSILEVSTGKTLSLIGGDIEIPGGFDETPGGLEFADFKGNLNAPGGRINLASIASRGEVTSNAIGESPDLRTDAKQLGSIHLSQALLKADGAGGGTIFIRAGQFFVDKSEVAASVESDARSAEEKGIGIDVRATGDVVIDNESILSTHVLFGATQDSGGVRITADRFEIRNDAEIRSIAFGEGSAADGTVLPPSRGNSGDIEIYANRFVALDGGGIMARTGGSGDGGGITVKAKTMELLNGGFIGTQAFGDTSGNAGDIYVEADNVLLSSSAAPGAIFAGIISSTYNGIGAGGDVRVITNDLQLLDGAEISTPSRGLGRGGNIEIAPKDGKLNILISGAPSENFLSGGIFANTFGSGDGGAINITADSIKINHFASLQAGSIGDTGQGGNIRVTADSLELTDRAFISGRAFGSGNAGNIEINTDQLLISGPVSAADPFDEDSTGIFTVAKDGRAGDIRITATNDFTLTSRGSISSSSFGSGRGGNVEITTRQLQVLDGSNILASAFGSGDGGAIRVTADEIKIAGVHPEPFTDVTGDTSLAIPAIATQAGVNGGNAGKIQISAGRLQLLDGGSLASDTFGTGQGGHIDIKANEMLISGVSEVEKNFYIKQGLDPIAATRIAASSITAGADNSNLGEKATGNAGRITIQASSLQLQDYGRISTTTNSLGAGGDIELQSNSITLSKNASILARSEGKGNAGNIRVTTSDHFLSKNSTVATSANQAAGGNIEIRSSSLVTLIDSNITTSVTGGDENAGNIAIAGPAALTLVEGSRVQANAIGGNGGNLNVTADTIIADAPARRNPDRYVGKGDQRQSGNQFTGRGYHCGPRSSPCYLF